MTNPYLSIRDKKYQWSDVTSLKMYGWDSFYGAQHLQITFADGYSTALFNVGEQTRPNEEEVINLMKLAKARNIPISVEPLDVARFKPGARRTWLKYGEDFRKRMLDLFDQAYAVADRKRTVYSDRVGP